MKRRGILSLITAIPIVTIASNQINSNKTIEYSRTQYDRLITSGEPLLLDFTSHS